MNEYLNVMRNHYADFSGRARRREYWMFALINGIIAFVLQLPVFPFVIQSVVASANGETDVPLGAPAGLALVGLVLSIVYGLAVLVPSLAVSVRRLHDTGKSGWWYLLSLVPFGGLVLLIFFLLDSDPGANRWGPNPKGVGSAAGAVAPGGADW